MPIHFNGECWCVGVNMFQWRMKTNIYIYIFVVTLCTQHIDIALGVNWLFEFFLLHFYQYVNEVVIGAPYSVTVDLMNHFKVDVVCHGQTDIALENGCQDPYAVPKTMGKFVLVNSGE